MTAPFPANAVDYVGAKGRCDQFVIAGNAVQCGGVAIVSQTDNDRIQVQIPYGNDGLLMFSGKKDGSHKNIPAMAVDNVSVGKQRFTAQGGCLVSIGAREMFFGCDAEDVNGKKFSAYFKGNVIRD